MTQEYPLAWPEGWPRAKSRKRGQFKSAGSDITNYRAEQRAIGELGRLVSTSSMVVSSNVIRDREPKDPGVAMYWRERESGTDRVIAIDIYDRAADNLAAIAATIEAMRAIDRHGGATILNRAFTGFTALPPPADCWKELGLARAELSGNAQDAVAQIAQAHRSAIQRCRRTNPAGDHPSEATINAARDQALKLVTP